MATTRLGLLGSWAAYLGFVAKAQAVTAVRDITGLIGSRSNTVTLLGRRSNTQSLLASRSTVWTLIGRDR